MMEFLAVAVITILAVISPGADFAIVTKNSYLYGRHIGVLTALGIALGVLVHVAYTLLGLAVLLKIAPNFLTIIKYLGAVYLIYLGYQTFRQPPVQDSQSTTQITHWQALRYGFFTNALNPKTTLFVVSTFTQIVSPTTAKFILLGYGLFMSLAHFMWFVIVAMLFSQATLRAKMLNHQRLINRMIGVILASLGVMLVFANLK